MQTKNRKIKKEELALWKKVTEHDKVIGKYDFIDQALYEIFGELSSSKIRLFFKELGVSTDFQSYGIYQKELDELKSSIENNERASNSLVSLF